ncbi:MAG TPA: hypothetical protein VFU78_22830 [Thermomicrobiales bacterium]|jgi:hypothetical protein|nr:hypothetical protein [Thermomicrobiales bacterium]
MNERHSQLASATGVAGEPAPMRLAVGRVRLGPLARAGFSMGWLAALLPAAVGSGLTAYVLHGIWRTLDRMEPWTPWPRDTHILGAKLPTPELDPRDVLRLNGLYHALTPVGHHPFLSALLGMLVLMLLGGLIVALTVVLLGMAYNLFARLTGGIELELTPPVAGRAARAAQTGERAVSFDEADLRW